MNLTPIVRLAPSLSLLSLLSLPLAAQHAIVVSRVGTAPAAVLLDVDLVTFVVTPLPRFPSDVFAPRAIAVDPVNRDLIIALDSGAGSRIVRVLRRGSTFAAEQRVTDLAGAVVTRLAFGLEDDLIVTTDGPSGALLRVPRTGGAPATIASVPRATALCTPGLHASHALVAQSGTAGVDPQTRLIDLRTGATTIGPNPFTGFTPLGITGIVDLPTALFRQWLSHDDGSVSLSVNFATPTKIPMIPAHPAGATRAMHGLGLEAIALGGQAHPYLKGCAYPPTGVWMPRSAVLPGDPVDFALDYAIGAGVVTFGAACSQLTLQVMGGAPTLGNAAFGLDLRSGLPAQAALLLLGTSDLLAGGVPLPVPLPPALCLLRVAPDLGIVGTADALGSAPFPLPIPNHPALHGGIVFAQHVQASGAGLVTGFGAAVHLAR